VSTDGHGNVYLSGSTQGSLDGTNAGEGGDAFFAKYDGAGNLLWARQFGTSANEAGTGISADGLGNVYFSGQAGGSLFAPNAGLTDAFVGKFTEAIPGDYNNSGIVDAADYNVWRDHLGQTFALPNRSAANSGPIATADFSFWKSQFGQHAGSSAGDNGSGAVPELSSLMLLVTGCVAGLVVRRRQ
jgi:hypothetical protein